MMGTGADTFAAANTKITVVIHNLPRAVVAHFGGAYHDTAVAVNAFVFVYVDNRPQGFFFHLFLLSIN
jgi:hypothetical protein